MGNDLNLRVLQDVVKEILSLLKLKPKSKHFAFLRIPDEKTFSTVSPNEFLDKLQKTRGTTWSDHEADLKKQTGFGQSVPLWKHWGALYG